MNDFLTLMTAQLQNQDPLNPTDSNQFLSQLSELSTVEGITQLNTSMTTLSDSMLSSQALTSASLVGQSVLTPATSATGHHCTSFPVNQPALSSAARASSTVRCPRAPPA